MTWLPWSFSPLASATMHLSGYYITKKPWLHIIHKRVAVVRFHKYNKDAEPSNWYRAKLMLFYPGYNEQTDLLGGCQTYEEHYRQVQQ